jgi:hypothetical protein
MKLLEANENLDDYINHQMRITKRRADGVFKDSVYEGTFRGLSPLHGLKATRNHSNGPLWLLDARAEEQHFHHPGGGWDIYVLD